MSRKEAPEPRTDRSAIARLVHEFGLLLIKGDFERYLDERPLLNHAIRDGRINEHVPLNEQHMLRFVPLLGLLGVDDLGRNPQFRYFEEIDQLQKIEAFLLALKLTVDFSVQLSELCKKLKRKFKTNPNALTLPYRTEQLISNELVRHCQDVMWILEEFHVEAESDDIDAALWDVNVWTIVLDADKLHQEQGRVHSAFAHYLEQYQSSKSGGSPRVYMRTALTVLLAECFEDFDRKKRPQTIHDRSKSAILDEYGKKVGNREAYYNSAFARFLIEFVKITKIFDPVPEHKGNSLDQFKTIADLRRSQNTPRLTDRLKTSLLGREASEIIEILDSLKF